MLAQVCFLIAPGKNIYRREERVQAFVAWKQSGTPESKAAWEAEEALREEHLKWNLIVFVGGFFVLNGLLCWGLEKYVIKPATLQTNCH